MRGSQLGYTLFSLLVTLGCAAILLSISLRGLQQMLQIRRSADRNLSNYQGVLQLKRVLESALDSYDMHRLTIPPIVHPPGRIANSLGAEIEVSSVFAPHPETTAISFLTLEPPAAALMQSCSIIDGASAHSTYCVPIISGLIENAEVQSPENFVALTTQGTYSVLASHASNGRCRTARVTPSANIVLKPIPDNQLCFASLIMPVIREETWYRDIKGTLRVLTHLSGSVTSNQPVKENFEPYTITTEMGGPGIITLIGDIDLPASGTHSFSVNNHISRRSHISFLMDQAW